MSFYANNHIMKQEFTTVIHDDIYRKYSKLELIHFRVAKEHYFELRIDSVPLYHSRNLEFFHKDTGLFRRIAPDEVNLYEEWIDKDSLTGFISDETLKKLMLGMLAIHAPEFLL